MTLTAEEKLARLTKALEYGGNTHSVADVVALVKEGRAQFWENGDGCIVSEIEPFPQKKAVRFWLISGELKACLALEDRILTWAREKEGCTVAIASGRRGWGRAAAPTGWRLHGYLFWKPLL